MTMPHERTKALIAAVEFLRDLHCAPDTPACMRDHLVGILRHLPEGRAIELEAKRQGHERGQSAWLLPPDFYSQPHDLPATEP